MIIEPDFDPAMLIDDFKKYLAAGDVGESFMGNDFGFYIDILLNDFSIANPKYLIHLSESLHYGKNDAEIGKILANLAPTKTLLEIIQNAFDELYDVQEFCDSHSIPYQTFVDEYDYNGVSRADFF